MTKREDLAFPTNQVVNDCDGNFMATISHAGLTKREYFAALAMQGFVSSNRQGWLKEYAEASIDAADFLIAELNKKENEG